MSNPIRKVDFAKKINVCPATITKKMHLLAKVNIAGIEFLEDTEENERIAKSPLYRRGRKLGWRKKQKSEE